METLGDTIGRTLDCSEILHADADLRRVNRSHSPETGLSSFREQVMRKRYWVWRVIGGLSLILACITAVALVADYRKTIFLRNQIGLMSTGTSESDVLNLLGPPDSVWNGSRRDPSTGKMVGGYSVWIYCSRFDWDGQRSRWNDAPFMPYWMSRIDPAIDNNYDAVIELWLRNGQLESIENSVIENLLGRTPKLSL